MNTQTLEPQEQQALKVGVMGAAGHGIAVEHLRLAEELGEVVAAAGCVLITGGCPGLPLIVRRGFHGPIYCTKTTASLLPILLRDAAHLQEEDAAFANKRRFSKHHPALPLFSVKDVEKTLPLVVPCDYHTSIDVTKHATVTFRRTGHILGAASIDLLLAGTPDRRLVYSGDLGRWNRLMLRDPEFVPEADVLLVESTYGDRLHPPEDPSDGLARVINNAV